MRGSARADGGDRGGRVVLPLARAAAVSTGLRVPWRRFGQLPLLVPIPDDDLGRTVLRRAVHAGHALVLRPLLDRRRTVQVSQPHGPLRIGASLPHLHALWLDVPQHDAGRVRGLHREDEPREDLARVLLSYSASLLDQREQVRARAALRRRELADDERPLGAAQQLVKPREAAQVVLYSLSLC